MTRPKLRNSWPILVAAAVAAGALTREVALSEVGPLAPQEIPTPVAIRPASLVQKGDRVAWIGSSSTRIGIWPKTVEFLLRTRHPSLVDGFQSFSTGGGTFATGLENIDAWLDASKPTVVFLNYGANDAGVGFPGLSAYKERMGLCVAKARSHGARVVLVTPQASDPRKSGKEAATKRALYADVMIDHGREHGWTVIDVHQPLDALQKGNQQADPTYTILKDKIHLTPPAYVAWGFTVYDRLDLPKARSAAVISMSGRVVMATGCEVRDVVSSEDCLSFTRVDHVLPILPPGPLPPRLSVPLESQSSYMLTVVGLPPGNYEVTCEGKPIGRTDQESLGLGVNLNSLLLDSGNAAPWADLAKAVWDGEELARAKRSPWRFEVRKVR